MVGFEFFSSSLLAVLGFGRIFSPLPLLELLNSSLLVSFFCRASPPSSIGLSEAAAAADVPSSRVPAVCGMLLVRHAQSWKFERKQKQKKKAGLQFMRVPVSSIHLSFDVFGRGDNTKKRMQQVSFLAEYLGRSWEEALTFCDLMSKSRNAEAKRRQCRAEVWKESVSGPVAAISVYIKHREIQGALPSWTIRNGIVEL